MLCAEENHSFMYHICAKGFLDSSINKAIIDKISFLFQEIAPYLTYSQKPYF